MHKSVPSEIDKIDITSHQKNKSVIMKGLNSSHHEDANMKYLNSNIRSSTNSKLHLNPPKLEDMKKGNDMFYVSK